MGKEKKVKEKCCQKYEKKGKHCKSCPELQQCILPHGESEKKLKGKEKDRKKSDKKDKKDKKKDKKKK